MAGELPEGMECGWIAHTSRGGWGLAEVDGRVCVVSAKMGSVGGVQPALLVEGS